MTILHLERSRFFQKIVGEITLSKGFFYRGCDSIAEAFERLQAEQVDLILTSRELEGETGEDFVHTLNGSSFRDIPVIVITSEDSLDVRERFFSLGVVDYILKKDLSAERFSAYIEDMTRQDTLTSEILKMNYAVLDDSNLSRQIIASTLKIQGILNIDNFSHPKELLEEEKEYDVYFVDMVMPDMSGEEVIRALRKKNRKAVIITISSINNFKTISQVLNVGANDYILKPFDAGIFMARLRANVRTFLLMNELEDKNRQLELLSITDGLTGIYNHRHILQRLTEEIEKRYDKPSPLSILLMDIDHFKNINDDHGHLVGDGVLRFLVEIFRNIISERDIFGRYGGEEFLLVLPGLNGKEAFHLSDAIREKVCDADFTDVPEGVTFSGGVVEWGKDDDTRSIIKKADDLLYRAKTEGRNRILT